MGPMFLFAKYCVRTNIMRMNIHVMDQKFIFYKIYLYNCIISKNELIIML